MLLHVAELPGHFTSSFTEEVVQNERKHMEESERMLDALVPDKERRGVDLRKIVKSATPPMRFFQLQSRKKPTSWSWARTGATFLAGAGSDRCPGKFFAGPIFQP
jgi:hypothetical protein